MAPKPKPKPARFVFTVFTVGMVLAMALTILTITADRDLAAPITSPITILNFRFCIKAVDQVFCRRPWTPDGESIVEHVAGVEDYHVALAMFLAACQRWPGTPIALRQGARVIEDSRRLRVVYSERAPGVQ